MADQNQPFDVKKVIEQSASKTTLQELAKKGIHRVKVLDEAAITRMIGEAVERIIGTKTNLMSSEDRAKLVDASRKELDKLMKEFNESKDRSELLEKDKTALATEVENFQRQLQVQRKYTDELAKQRYEEGKSIMKQQVDDLRAQLDDARKSGGEEARRAQQTVIEEVKSSSDRRLLEMKSAAENRLTEIERHSKQKEEDLRAAGEKRFEEGVKSQQPLIAELQRRINETEQRISTEKEAEFSRKLLEERERESKKREELQATNIALNQKLAQSMEDMKKSDEDLFKKLTELFTKSIESLNKKLTDLRLRALAGGGLGSATMPGDVEFRPSQATIEGMLSTELQSNLKAMEVEGKTGGKISSALERLKAMRGGTGETKKEEKKEEGK